jgi:predicted transcriptional regulator
MAREADPKVRRIIARNLQRALRQQGKGVVTVATSLQMPQAQFSGYLRGHRGFSIETLLRLSVGLSCSLDDLVANVNEDYTAQTIAQRHRSLEPDIATAVEDLCLLAPAPRAAAIRIVREFTHLAEPVPEPTERAREEVTVPAKKRRQAS